MTEHKKLVETEVEDGIATVRLNNPPANALTPSLFAALTQIRGTLASSQIRAVILTGVNRVFSVGGDLGMLSLLSSRDEAARQAREGRKIIEEFFSLEKPFIAAVNGLCLGGGLEIALICHLRVCGLRARFGFPELSLGFIPALGGIGRLTRLMGQAKALEMILTGRTINAREAYRTGLVNRCVPPRQVLGEAKRLARLIARAEPAAAMAALELVEHTDSVREAELFGTLVTRPVVKKNLEDLLG